MPITSSTEHLELDAENFPVLVKRWPGRIVLMPPRYAPATGRANRDKGRVGTPRHGGEKLVAPVGHVR
jgi:hypothetical protein